MQQIKDGITYIVQFPVARREVDEEFLRWICIGDYILFDGAWLAETGQRGRSGRRWNGAGGKSDCGAGRR